MQATLGQADNDAPVQALHTQVSASASLDASALVSQADAPPPAKGAARRGKQVTMRDCGADCATPWSLAEESGRAGVACQEAGEHGAAGARRREAAESDGHVGTLCCWALLNLSTFEPAQVCTPPSYDYLVACCTAPLSL